MCVANDRSQWVPDRIDRDHGVREGESLVKEPVREEHLAASSMDNRFAYGDHIIQGRQDNGQSRALTNPLVGCYRVSPSNSESPLESSPAFHIACMSGKRLASLRTVSLDAITSPDSVG